MVINCHTCGRPLCELDMAEFKPIEANAVKRMLRGFLGIDLPQIEALLNPTPEGLASTFNVRCHEGCNGAG